MTNCGITDLVLKDCPKMMFIHGMYLGLYCIRASCILKPDQLVQAVTSAIQTEAGGFSSPTAHALFLIYFIYSYISFMTFLT